MEIFSIHPHHGYLNTEFVLESHSDNDLSSKNLIDSKFLFLPAGSKRVIKLPAGKHKVHFKTGSDEQEETVVVEDAYRFGGSKLKYAYLTPNSPHAILVMLDRMYIYDYETDECWYENQLTPNSVEEVFPNILMFKTESMREIEGKTVGITHHSLFDIQRKTIILNFEKEVARTSNYIIFQRLIDESILTIYNFGVDLKFSWNLNVESYCVDINNDCLYFTKPDNKDNVYSFPCLSSFFHSYLKVEGDKVVIGINPLDILDGTVSFEHIAYELHSEKFIQFVGTHYAVTNRNVVDLIDNKAQALNTDWGDITSLNFKPLLDFDEELSQCTQGEDIQKMLRDKYHFCEGLVKRYSTINMYPLPSGIFWIEECWEAKANAYNVRKECVYKVLHSLKPIQTVWGKLRQLQLPKNASLHEEDGNVLRITIDNIKLYVNGDGALLGKYERTCEIKAKNTLDKEVPGVQKASSCVKYKNAESEEFTFDAVIYQDGRNFNVGIWDESLHQYIQKGNLSEKINSDSYNVAMFGSDNSGVLIKDANTKQFKWMDNDGTLREYSFDDTSFISKGINGYQPLIELDRFRQPVFVDPITSGHITPAYLANYVFTNPDQTLYADNNHSKHIRYKDVTTDTYISQGEFIELKKKLEYPEDRTCSLKDRRKKYKDIYEERLKKINELGLENIVNDDLLQQMPVLKNKTFEQQADFLASYSCFSVIDFYIREEQWIVIKSSDHNVYKEFYVGKPLWYLNYVSFSYDNRYVAVSGRYPNGQALGGLLFVYDLIDGKCVFDSTHEKVSYNAVWISSFNKHGLIGSWSTGSHRDGAITRLYELKDGTYVESQLLKDRNFLTFSASGNLVALSNQNYIPYDSERTNQGWGHQPSCLVFIFSTHTNSEIGSYNDFGYDRENRYSCGLEGVGQRKESVASVSFSPDEKRYLAVSRDGVVVVRNLPTELLSNEQPRIKSDTSKKTLAYNRTNDNYGTHYGEFAGSYAQDVMGYSDDVINDAFEGDPDAYWNID